MQRCSTKRRACHWGTISRATRIHRTTQPITSRAAKNRASQAKPSWLEPVRRLPRFFSKYRSRQAKRILPRRPKPRQTLPGRPGLALSAARNAAVRSARCAAGLWPSSAAVASRFHRRSKPTCSRALYTSSRVFSPKFDMPNRKSGSQLSRSLTVNIPRSSRQFVVRTDSPISAVLISSLSARSRSRSPLVFSGMRVPMGSLPSRFFRFPTRLRKPPSPTQRDVGKYSDSGVSWVVACDPVSRSLPNCLY